MDSDGTVVQETTSVLEGLANVKIAKERYSSVVFFATTWSDFSFKWFSRERAEAEEEKEENTTV